MIINLENGRKKVSCYLLFALLISIILFCCEALHIADSSSSPKQTLKLDESIWLKIDKTIDPCTDFYQFACGNFSRNSQVSDDESLVDTFSNVRNVLQSQLKEIITSPAELDDIESTVKVKKLYSACLDIEKIEEVGLSAIKEILTSIGGWPVLETDWNEELWTWQNATIKCRENGYSTDYIVDVSVSSDLKNSSVRVLDIDQSDLGLNQVFLLRGLDFPVVKAYHEYQIDMAVLYGADRKVAEKDMRDALEFEIALANISLPNEKRRNATALYNPMSIEQIQKRFDYNDWIFYFNSLLRDTSQVNGNETVIVYDLTFYDELGNLLNKTSKRAIANYIMWRVVAESTNYLTNQLRQRQQGYAAALIGTQNEEPRWKHCIGVVTDKFPIAIASAYARRYFDEKSKSIAMLMVEYIRDEFKKVLKQVAWMDKTTKKTALLKADKMVTHIGYPNELLNDAKIIEYYKNVDVDSSKYFQSILSLKVFEADHEYRRLRMVVNKTDWETHSKIAEVNAAYSRIENSIRFPAGILQGQFFSSERAMFQNFASIGAVIGHEITHGFDDQGRQFDADGNLIDWWDEMTSKAYEEKAQCIVEQFGNFTEPLTGLKLNGINTQGENIADNGGIKLAYRAYQAFAKANRLEEISTDDSTYTTNQLFWITSAQTWCAVFTEEAMKKRILTGVHSPNLYRVLGTLTNMKEFADDFQCSSMTPMNPAKKCQVW